MNYIILSLTVNNKYYINDNDNYVKSCFNHKNNKNSSIHNISNKDIDNNNSLIINSVFSNNKNDNNII